MQIQKTRNYIGLIGALLALLGFFCPFAASKSSWTFVNYVVEHDFGEYFESAKTFSKISIYFYVAYLLFIIAAGAAFLLAYHKAGLCLTALPMIFFLIIFLQEGPQLVTSSHIGFWFSAFGLILMLLANRMIGLNRKLFPNSVFTCQQKPVSDSLVRKLCGLANGKNDTNRKPGYIGIAGSVMTLVGFFMPFLSFLWVSRSLYEAFVEENALFAVIYIALLICVGLAYAFSRHMLGFLLSLPHGIYLVTILFSLPESSAIGEIQAGFWVTIIGVILIVISPFVTKKLSK